MDDNIATISQAGEKPSNSELNSRIADIADMLAQGLRRRDIATYVAKTSWHIAPRTLDRLIQKAKTQLARAGRTKADLIVGKVLYRLDSIYFQATQDNDYRTALESIRDLCQLANLPTAGRVGTPDDEDRPIAVVATPEEMRRAAEQRPEQIPTLKPGPLLRAKKPKD